MRSKRDLDVSVAIAREVVALQAPEELELFELTAEAHVARAGRGRNGDELLGFGADSVEAVITIAALAGSEAAVTSVAEMAGHGVAESVGRLVKRLRRDHEDEEVPVAALTTEQLVLVREAAVTRIKALGLPGEKAELVSDAIVGVLASRGGTQ